ncbi:MAG TPA: fructosamine kinase family protein [Tepidisphaeraceae bacterium]|nr:fructosamine kinase family protein [Tepidisphaeraceae bacterium]
MGQESDISWQVLRRIVEEWQGGEENRDDAAGPAELAEVKPLYGGCINTTLALTLSNGRQAVLKISAHRVDRSYLREAHQLQLLRGAGLPAPRVYTVHVGTLENPFSYLLMEFIEGMDWSKAQAEMNGHGVQGRETLHTHLAELLLALHGRTDPAYRRVTDDDSPRFEQWPQFFRSIYDPIWHEMRKSPLLGTKGRKVVERAHERLERLITHEDCPRLVHWDLWGANIMARSDGQGNWQVAALLDPNCKYAHFEAELAYLELFQTVGPVFFKVYQRQRKLPAEYQRLRKPVYQMYAMLNHASLFGERCAAPLSAAIERVAPLV